MELSEAKKKKKKPYSSKTITTGSPALNDAFFNMHMGTGSDEDYNKEIDKFIDDCEGVTGIEAATEAAGEASSDTGETSAAEGGAMSESVLAEAKRYVRRYYIRPQNIFCSNKAEILKALIDINTDNCTVYTLNNLGDDKDVTKLTNDDVIYYYDNEILYDKNHMKVMDYDLYIKHEEDRDKIDIAKASDAKVADVYEDRLTDQTELEEDIMEDEVYYVEPENKDFLKKWARYDAAKGRLISDFDDFVAQANADGYAVSIDDFDTYKEFGAMYLDDDNIYRIEEAAGSMADKVIKTTQNFTKQKGMIACNKGPQQEEVTQLLQAKGYTVSVEKGKGGSVNIKYLHESITIDNVFALDFDSYNAYGECLTEGKETGGVCCICGEEYEGYGNNAEPYRSGRCCAACNTKFVIPARLELIKLGDEE